MCLQLLVPATHKETAVGANADQSDQSWPWLVQSVPKRQAGKHISANKGPVSPGAQADCAVVHIFLMHFTRLSHLFTAVAQLNTFQDMPTVLTSQY